MQESGAVIQPQSKMVLFFQHFFSRMLYMMGYRAIISNLIALGLCGVVFTLLQFNGLLLNLGKVPHYFYGILSFLAVLQVLKSAKRSLLLPVLCILIAGVVIAIQQLKLFPLSAALLALRYLMWLGAAGLCISIFHIP